MKEREGKEILVGGEIFLGIEGGKMKEKGRRRSWWGGEFFLGTEGGKMKEREGEGREVGGGKWVLNLIGN